MPSVKQLVTRSFDLLQRFAILWLPPIALGLFNALLVPAGRGPGAVLFVVSALLSLAVTAGWLTLIARAEEGQEPTWDDFFIAIGRTFGSLIRGGVALAALMTAGVVPIMVATVLWAGPATIERLAKALEAMAKHSDRVADQLMTLDPALLTALTQLATGLAVALVWVVVVGTLLLFWQQAIVLRDLSWRSAWKQSAQVVKGHFGYLMGLLTLLSVFFIVGAALGAAPFPLGVLGWAVMLGAQAVSTVALTLFYLKAAPTSCAASSDEPTQPAS